VKTAHESALVECHPLRRLLNKHTCDVVHCRSTSLFEDKKKKMLALFKKHLPSSFWNYFWNIYHLLLEIFLFLKHLSSSFWIFFKKHLPSSFWKYFWNISHFLFEFFLETSTILFLKLFFKHLSSSFWIFFIFETSIMFFLNFFYFWNICHLFFEFFLETSTIFFTQTCVISGCCNAGK